MTAGERVLLVAKAKKIKLGDIADKLGLSPTGISLWGKEGRNIPSKYLSAVAKILDVSEGFLLNGEGEPSIYNIEKGRSEATKTTPSPTPANPPDLVAVVARLEKAVERQDEHLGTLLCNIGTLLGIIDKLTDGGVEIGHTHTVTIPNGGKVAKRR